MSDLRPSRDLRERLQRTLGDTFTIDRELGRGGMSRVFVATESSLGRQVVFKVIAPELAGGMSAERFAREVRLAARLQQPNIVPLLTAGNADGIPYYTMPFVSGQSLRERMHEGRIPVSDAIHILRDVARALAYAHENGVVHRDIKPENILLSGGTAAVTDFGIAKAFDASRATETRPDGKTTSGITLAGASIGTPAYMAPEQALGDPNMDFRADLYSWGMIAWEIFAGEHVFARWKTFQALVAAHVTEAPPPLGSRRADLPDALVAVIMQCLEKTPARRPASAADILRQLDAPVAAATVTPPEGRASQAVRASNKSRALVRGAGLVALVLIVVIWWYLTRL